MKGKISLTEFIEGVKKELFEAVQKGADNPFFSLEDVELETEFSVEAEGSAGFKFVVDLKGSASGSQTHRVKLHLKPIPQLKIALEEGKILLENTTEIDHNTEIV